MNAAAEEAKYLHMNTDELEWKDKNFPSVYTNATSSLSTRGVEADQMEKRP